MDITVITVITANRDTLRPLGRGVRTRYPTGLESVITVNAT